MKYPILIGMFSIANMLPTYCSESCFFCQFALRGLQSFFSNLHLAAGKRPQACAMHIVRSTEQQHFTVAVESGDERNGLMEHASNTKDFIGKVAAQGAACGQW